MKILVSFSGGKDSQACLIQAFKQYGGGNLKKIYSNPELAKFSPRELIAELKARGYTGELKYTQTISL
jgi:tRNA(Ile)-lysidine synthase TilS/MesJ